MFPRIMTKRWTSTSTLPGARLTAHNATYAVLHDTNVRLGQESFHRELRSDPIVAQPSAQPAQTIRLLAVQAAAQALL